MIRMRDPFAGLLAVQRAFDDAMRSDWLGARTGGRGVYPPINVFRKEQDYVLVAELPGVTKDQLNIEVKGDQVRIFGEKTRDHADDDYSVHRRERAFGRFDRTITLPAAIETEQVKAELRDGQLALYLPRAEADKPRAVTIN